jgi:fructuronate reductase
LRAAIVIQRLHTRLLAALAPQVRRPGYERSAHGVGIVHLGVGAFHRAHQAVYVDDVLAQAGGDWRILGVSCRGSGVRDRLLPQDCLYTVHEHDGCSLRMRAIASIADLWVAAENPTAVIDAIARPATHLITLTVTEKGYCRAASGRGLDLAHPDIAHDLAQPQRPRSALGLLIEGLRERRRRGVDPATVISCDNLPGNGALLRQLSLEYALQRDAALADWIERSIAFPSTMVDRIVPATTAADIAAAAVAMGLTDYALVSTEPFTQWIIEDRFAGPRPQFELAGVRLVGDVRPFETAKLRLLNGSHSTLAYLGVVAGFSYVHEAIAAPDLLALIRRLQRELAPTLAPTPGLDLDQYREALLARFANPSLQHRLQQIAMDGSQKLPQRLLPPLRECQQAGRPIAALALAVAAWMRYTLGRTDQGDAYVIDDPLAGRLRGIAAAAHDDAAQLAGDLLAVEEIFGQRLRHDSALVAAVSQQLERLLKLGARAAVQELLRNP